MLEVNGLTVRYGALTVVNNISFHVRPGQWLMLLGPNGAGKSTVINAVSQGAAYTGLVRIGGRDARMLKPNELARRYGVLTQHHAVGYAYTVEEVVRLGRYAYAPGAFSQKDAGDDAAVERALSELGLVALRRQSVLRLSGGELQRTFLAQLIAQDPPLLLLDEPTNYLDLAYQKQIFTLLTDWLRHPGRAIVSVVHDLSLARAYGTHALLLDRGQTLAQGEIETVVSEKNLSRAYGMNVTAWMRAQYAQWEREGSPV